MKVKRKALEEVVKYIQSRPAYIEDTDSGQFTGGYYEGYLNTNNGRLTFAFTKEGLYEISFESNKEIEQRIANHKNFQQALTDLVNTKVQNANRRT